jgi:hypothetical protein
MYSETGKSYGDGRGTEKPPPPPLMLWNVSCGSRHPKIFFLNSKYFGFIEKQICLISRAVNEWTVQVTHKQIAVFLRKVANYLPNYMKPYHNHLHENLKPICFYDVCRTERQWIAVIKFSAQWPVWRYIMIYTCTCLKMPILGNFVFSFLYLGRFSLVKVGRHTAMNVIMTVHDLFGRIWKRSGHILWFHRSNYLEGLSKS